MTLRRTHQEHNSISFCSYFTQALSAFPADTMRYLNDTYGSLPAQDILGFLVKMVQETTINTVHLNGSCPYSISFSTKLQRFILLLAIKPFF